MNETLTEELLELELLVLELLLVQHVELLLDQHQHIELRLSRTGWDRPEFGPSHPSLPAHMRRRRCRRLPRP